MSARLVRWALGGALILAAAGCGPAQMTAGNGGAHIPSSLAPSTLGAPSGGVTEIYAIPAAVPQYDGTLFAHTAGTAYASDQPLGAGTGGFVVPAVAPNDAASPIAQWFDSTTDQVMFANPGASVVSFGQKSSGPTAVPISSLYANGILYFQQGDLVVASRGGGIVATYPLPTLVPDPSAGLLPAGYKGVALSGPAVGMVSALVPLQSGDILAFSFTGQAAAVTDLMTGQTVSLGGYSRLGAAARTSGGNLVVLAWKAQDEFAAVQVLLINSTSLAVTDALDTGVAATNLLQDVILPGLGQDAVIAVSRGDQANGVTLGLWELNGTQLASGPTLPINSGLTIAPAGPSAAYVYGGPAKNAVGQLDLATGAFTPDVPALRAPTDAYVVGVLAG